MTTTAELADRLVDGDWSYDAPVAYDQPTLYSPPWSHPTTLRWYGELGQVLRDGQAELDWPLLAYLDVLAAPAARIDDLVRDSDAGPGWSPLLDVDRTPADALATLAMYVGLRLPPGITPAAQRDLIRNRPNWQRGSRPAVRRGAQTHLEGGKRVAIHERTRLDDYGADHPWRIVVDTFAAETPDPAATADDVAAEIAIGNLHAYRTLDGATYDQLAAEFATVADFEAAFETTDEVRFHLPAMEVLAP